MKILGIIELVLTTLVVLLLFAVVGGGYDEAHGSASRLFWDAHLSPILNFLAYPVFFTWVIFTPVYILIVLIYFCSRLLKRLTGPGGNSGRP